MEAGPGMDLSVAEAIGKEATVYFDHDLQVNVCLLLPGDVRFVPSTDWNDAMFAAERFGLFGDGHYCALSKDDGWYCILPMSELDAPGHELNGAGLWWPGTPLVARDVSGPLAICRAILKLHHGG